MGTATSYNLYQQTGIIHPSQGLRDIAVIDPLAQIATTAQLGDNVRIHAFAIIEDGVIIGDNCTIESFAMIRKGTRMGSNNHIHPHAVIGGDPQDLSFDSQTETFTVIGNDCTFREHSTVQRATQAGAATQIGDGCFFMNYCHAAHDCTVGDYNILANAVQLGGHTQTGERVFFGAGSMAHQFCRIGSFAMVAALIGIRKDILPFTLVGGSPVKHYRINSVGLRRAGINAAGLREISAATRQIRQQGHYAPDNKSALPQLQELETWLASPSKRGIYGWADSNK